MKALFVFLLSTACLGQITKSDADFAKNVFYPATALLYSQDENGSLKMRCTATAIEKHGSTLTYVTAAHCGCQDSEEEHTVSPEKTFFFITPDMGKTKEFLRAKPIACGYRHAGDDFFLLNVDSTDTLPTVPLGKDPQVLDQVVNVASPLGLGRQIFVGTVSAANLDRPVVEEDINWSGATLLQLFGTDGGSSGSAVVCLDQKAICAFVVGHIDKTTIVAMPVSRLINLRERIANGTYKHWIEDPDKVTDKK